jgi:hypothetical protein
LDAPRCLLHGERFDLRVERSQTGQRSVQCRLTRLGNILEELPPRALHGKIPRIRRGRPCDGLPCVVGRYDDDRHLTLFGGPNYEVSVTVGNQRAMHVDGEELTDALLAARFMACLDPLGREINTPEVRQATAAAISGRLLAAGVHHGVAATMTGELAGAVYVVLDRASAGAPLDPATEVTR